MTVREEIGYDLQDAWMKVQAVEGCWCRRVSALKRLYSLLSHFVESRHNLHYLRFIPLPVLLLPRRQNSTLPDTQKRRLLMVVKYGSFLIHQEQVDARGFANDFCADLCVGYRQGWAEGPLVNSNYPLSEEDV